eukprot:scaffold259317_cov96-Cyclotella_meneghiniana.AAC.3
MGWKWVNGVPQLRTLRQLLKYTLTIPQKGGSPAAIPLRGVGDAEETLGVWSCPDGDFGVHIEKKMEVGHLWVERLRRNKCPAADGWLGFRYSLIPKVTYGFAAITIDPDVLESAFQWLYRDVQSPLRVNENITKFYRMAPKRVMGLGMPNPGIKMLAYKLHLLQTEWNQPTSAGQMLQQSLEIFQMETGLSTNVIEQDYDRFENLATGVLQICFQDPRSDWRAINRVRKYKGVHSLADMVLCDGRTVDPWVLTTEGSDSSCVFSVEKPTRSDFATFRRAVTCLTSSTHRLQTPLGAYVNKPHRRDDWFISEDQTLLFCATSDSSYMFNTSGMTLSATHVSHCHSPIQQLCWDSSQGWYVQVSNYLTGSLVSGSTLWHGRSVHLRTDYHSWSA